MDVKTIKHILNVLRRGTITWPERYRCLRKARKVVGQAQCKNGSEKNIVKFECQGCLILFPDSKHLQVDHIEEVGGFTGDFNEYIKRMYCPQDNLQALCVSCHAKKTSSFNASLLYKRKNNAKT